MDSFYGVGKTNKHTNKKPQKNKNKKNPSHNDMNIG